MKKEPRFRYYRCEGPAFELLKAYRDELEILADNHAKMHAEFQERSNLMHKHHQGNLHSMWTRFDSQASYRSSPMTE